jgi:hypothetical protein
MESLSLVYPLLGDNIITLYNSKGFQHNAANIRRILIGSVSGIFIPVKLH